MKILVTSDWHCDAVTAGVERIPELADYVDELVRVIDEEKISLVLNLGDCWDPGSVHDPRWGRFIYESFMHLSRSAAQHECYDASSPTLIAIPGNHDVIDLERPTSTLSPLAAAEPDGVQVFEAPAFATIPMRGGAILYVLALPYVSRAYERTAAYAATLAGAVEAVRQRRRAAIDPLVVIGHLSFEGMHPGSETEDMARGREVPFPVDLIATLSPDVVLNGHYHARQTIKRGALTIEIPGAPIRFTFGEARDGERGFLVLEV